MGVLMGSFDERGVEIERLNLRQNHTAAAIRAIQNSKRTMVTSFVGKDLAV